MGTKKKTLVEPRRAVSTVASTVLPLFNLDRVVSEAEAAEIIGYSKDTLRREFRAGRAPERIRISGRLAKF